MRTEPLPSARAPTVLVPVDLSPCGNAVLPVARELARLEDATPRILHVSEDLLAPSEVAARLGLDAPALESVVLDVRQGVPAEQIVRAALEEPSRCIVLCPRLSSAHGLGHVAEAVLRAAPCPVVLVAPERGAALWRLRELLLPHDGTPTATDAMCRASGLARRAGARVRVLHVATAGAPGGEPGSFGAPRYLDQPHHEWPSWAHEFLARLSGPTGIDPERLRFVLGWGAPGEEVLRLVRETEPDLVLLAWHGSADPARARTLRAVLARAPCPVMVVRIPAPPSSGAQVSP